MILKLSVFIGGVLLSAALCSGQALIEPVFVVAAGSAGYPQNPGYWPDVGYSGGSTDWTTNTIDMSYVNTDLYFWVYENERYGSNFSYTASGLTAGQSYKLKLHFAETTYTAVGQRQFNVLINGVPYLSNFDIIAECGAPNRAMVKSFVVTASSAGQVVVQFQSGAAGVAKVSALQLWTIPPPSSGTAVGATAVVQIAAGSAGPVAGGFAADTGYSGGVVVSNTATTNTSAVNNPAPVGAYLQARAGASNAGGFSYALGGLTAGQLYSVRLHFAENQYTAPLQRQFNVAINGVTALTNFDIFAEAGAANQAIVKSFAMAANASGQIAINFSPGASGVGAPIVSAIEIVTGFRMNSGGPGVSYWEEDQCTYGGLVARTTQSVDTSHAVNPAPMAVYQSELSGGTIYYTVRNLTPGYEYTVRLHFSDEADSAPGQREFNVTLNGLQVLTNYDIMANAVVGSRANIQQFTTLATSAGQINLLIWNGSRPTPSIDGLEILGGSPAAAGTGQYKISGVVVLGSTGPAAGTPIAGATVTLGGTQTAFATTAADGSYFFIVSAGGSYTLTASWPSSPYYSMSGVSPISNISANQPNENFMVTLVAGGSLAPLSPLKEYVFMNGAVVAVEHAH